MSAPSPAIQKQIDKANAIHAEVYGPASVIDALPGAEPVDKPAKAPEAAPIEAVEAITVEPIEGGDPSITEPMDSVITTDEDDESKFEHKYKVLQGKYNKEVPLLSNQVKDLNAEMNSMRTLMASLEAVNSQTELRPGEKLLKDEEIEDYGSDMIDVVKRAAREEFMPLITQLQTDNTRLKELLGGMSKSVTGDAREKLYDNMTKEVPNWEEINRSNGFLDWLDGTDTFSGTQRGSLLTQAFDKNDTARVMAFFKSYLNENAIVSTVAPVVPPAEPKVDLMSMAAPGTARTQTPQRAQAEKSVYTHAGIAAFYRDVQVGKFKGREEEQRAIEQDILIAPSEGRIR